MMQLDLNALTEQCKENCQLLNVTFVLLNKCDQSCVHCYIPGRNSNGLTTQKIKDLIVEARALGALNITLTGGEILLRNDLFEIIEFARRQYLRVFLMSNAYSLNEQKIEHLSRLGIAEFSTTLFSMNAETHNAITRKGDSFERVYNNILLLHKYGIPVTIKTPLMEMNKNDYKDVEAFAREYKFNFMTTTTIFSKTNGDDSPHQFRVQNDLLRIINDTEQIMNTYRSQSITSTKHGIPCSAGFCNVCINYDGNVWPCNTLMLSIGNVNTKSLIEIWKKSKELIIWRKKSVVPIKECVCCELKDICLRCPGLALLEDKDLYGCSSSAKRIAIEKIKGGA